MHALRLTMALTGAVVVAVLVAGPAAARAQEPAQPAFAPGEVLVGVEGGGSRVLEPPAGTSVREAIAKLERDPEVEFAAPNWTARAALTPFDRGTSGKPGGWQDDQWSFLGRPGGIRIGGAWDRLVEAGAPGGAGTTVAVVDTGIAYAETANGHALAPDFAATQFVPGIDLVDDDATPFDENGHGTHVAGTIAEQVSAEAPSASDDYLTGIAYGARLMPVRVLDKAGTGGAEDVGEGILWAAKHGADVINLSLQFEAGVTGCGQVPTVCDAVRKARKRGALVVAAAGNALNGNGKRRALYPGAAPGVFAVGATTEHGCLAAYSHFGKRTDLLAPGGGLPRSAAIRNECVTDQRPVLQLTFDCFPACSGGFGRFSIRPDLGTSMAAAHTSGVAALVRASGVAGVEPKPKILAARLQCTARPGIPARFYGPGSLDALRATDPARNC